MTTLYRKILIANRGEVACRIARTLTRLGIAAATVHSRADTHALHVQTIGESVLIGEGPARQSYLDVQAVVDAARRVGADALHPGFGFLSENPALASACEAAGIAFIGPSAEVLSLFGDKAASKRLAARLGIPTAAGLDPPSEDLDQLLRETADLPLPCIVKAVAGGGGKGMRLVREPGAWRDALEAAIREGRSAFGDGRVIAERYLEQPRHVEVQVLGDGQGGVIHLHDRECSLQRRHQKVVEEAPALGIGETLRAQLQAHAVALAREVRYRGLGTVEFAVTGREAVFLEVNPRLQVEHTVTEEVTGLDLVELQIRTVASGRLPMQQHEVPAPRGAAVQARLYAEDAEQGFLPSTGRVAVFEVPGDVRCDAGVAAGSEISPHYDPMIAKLIAHGPTRAQALHALRSALARSTVLGVTHNRAFLLALLSDPAVIDNALSTEFIDGWLAAQPAAAPDTARVAAAMACWLAAHRGAAQPLTAVAGAAPAGAWHDLALTGWRQHKGLPLALTGHAWQAGTPRARWAVGFGPGQAPGQVCVRVDGATHQVALPDSLTGWQGLAVDGHTLQVRACVPGAEQGHVSGAPAPQVAVQFAEGSLTLDVQPLARLAGSDRQAGQGHVRAPMMGMVVAVHVQPGQSVQAGERLATLESMKMEIGLTAPLAGTVGWIGCTTQGKVERHQELFRIEAA